MSQEMLFLLCLVGAAGALVWAVWWAVARDPIEERLRGPTEASGPMVPRRPQMGAEPARSPELSRLLQQVGQTVGKPFQPRSEEDKNALRQRLSHAGIYSRAGMSMFVGARLVLLIGSLLGGAAVGGLLGGESGGLLALLLGLGGAMAGFLGPTFWLDWRIRQNQTSIEQALPDALDLLVVCVESGLTVDAAFQRVGREIALAHPALARELATAHLENQMGIPRTEALRNIYRRTGSKAVQSLTAMLVQADRFGTSIAQALRIYSESLRIKRRHKAEEKAATAAVKITFPLVLFIFPALLIVIGGPAMLKLIALEIMR